MLDPQLFSHGTTITSDWLNQIQNRNSDNYNFFESLSLVEKLDVQVGNLTYDLSTKLQQFIDEVYTKGGGTIYLPSGKYRLDSSIYMKRGIMLVGTEHAVSASQYWETSPEGGIIGASRLYFGNNVTTAGILFDFQITPREARPYGSGLINLLVSCTSQPANTDGVLIRNPPAGEGPFNSGFGSGAVRLINTSVRGAPRYGVYVVSTATEKTNVALYRCRISSNGSHGIYVVYSYDMLIEHTFSFSNGGDGIRMENTATERVLECDIFSNIGNGITLDGYDGRYENNHIDQNNGHGIQVKATATSITNKSYRIIGGRIAQNGMGADNTYSNIRIEDRSGTLCGNITILGVTFGTAPQTNANRLAYCLSSSILTTQIANKLVACQIGNSDVKTGNEPLNDAFWQGTEITGTTDPAGQVYEQKWYPLVAGSGSFWQPNVLRGVKRYVTQNTAATTLYGLTAGSSRLTGREYYILINDTFTGVDFTGTTLKGNGGVDLAAGASTVGKILHLINVDGTNWACNILG